MGGPVDVSFPPVSHTAKEYQADPTRCCPWCTESQRRRAVHAGNERKQEELATAVEKRS